MNGRIRGAGHQDEPQICAVVDHPKLEHDWLWEIFGSRVRRNVEIDQTFDETEDLPAPLPRQEVTRSELIIPLPKEVEGGDEGQFDLGEIEGPATPREDWREILASFVYEPTTMEITRVDIEAVIGKELAGKGWRQYHSAPERMTGEAVKIDLSDEDMRDAIKSRLLEDAEEMAVVAGYAAMFKSQIYSAMIAHVREKFLGGNSLGLADSRELAFAFKKLPEVRRKMLAHPGLVAGMIEYGD